MTSQACKPFGDVQKVAQSLLDRGYINCSPSPLNYWQAPAFGGFAPSSPICLEFGSNRTPLLKVLNRGHESRGPTRYLVLRNTDTSFVYFDRQDGVLAPVPAQDRDGNPHDFSSSASLEGAREVGLVGQGVYDPILGTAHMGILNSPASRRLAGEFLTAQRLEPPRR